MKMNICLFAMALVVAAPATFAADHDEKVEVKTATGGTEFKMKVKRGDNNKYVGMYDGREYELRGQNLRIDADGEYVVHGTMSTDRTYIDTREVRPLTVETRTTTTESRPVVRERIVERPVYIEKKEPLIKLPGIEINP